MRRFPSARGRLSAMVAGIALLAAVSGCTQFGTYRRAPIVGQGSAVTVKEVHCAAGWMPAQRLADRSSEPPCEPDKANEGSPEKSSDVGASSIQRRHYLYRGEGDAEATRRGDYDLAFVEFDDQGWYPQRPQMEALFMLLRRIERERKDLENGHALIFVYVHGWKHNASACDNNVICFSRLLERMDILERNLRGEGQPRRRVVGVYVGWRGLSVDAGALSNITFWTRKDTAQRVGRGGVTELFMRLEDYREARNRHREENKTQLVVAGHSFGGMVVYSALAHPIMERAAEVNSCRVAEESGAARRSICYETARSFGDLVVLVNPAFEGTLYEPLFHIATNRCYGPEQRPVMLTVTSQGDDATGIAFPFGRWVNTRFEHAASDAQRASIRQTVGHNDRYQTHELRWRGTPAEASRKQNLQEPSCGCPYLELTETFKWWEFAERIKFRSPGATKEADSKGVAKEADPKGGPPPGTADVPKGSPAPTPDAKKSPPRPTPVQSWVVGDRRVYNAYGDQTWLVGDTKYSANYPYLVVKADAEIIADHNAIYSEPFIRFLHSFFLVHIAGRRPFEAVGCAQKIEACQSGGLIPCEQSCSLPDGGSCSGRSVEDLLRQR